MQFATEFWSGRAIAKMKELVEYLGLWLGETPTHQMKEPCCHSVETIYVGARARELLPDQARGAISRRSYNTFKAIYDSLCDGPSTVVQGGGIMLRGSLLAHYRQERWP